MGGLCREGHDFLRLCKKRNKYATLRLLDVLATQHAKWTARRIRRALFGQSLVDFSGPQWSSVKIHKSDKESESISEPHIVNRRRSKVIRIEREFSQAAVEKDKHVPKSTLGHLVPGMSQYEDIGTVDEQHGSTSFSPNTTNSNELPQFSDGFKESTKHIFSSPAER